MKIALSVLFSALLVLPACFPKRPEIMLPEVPAGELVHLLERHRQSFTGLSALARVTVQRKGRTRFYDTVGILLRSQQKLRIEAFTPLGQSMIVLVWDGNETLLRMAERTSVLRSGRRGLEPLLGVGIEMRELAAVLSGTAPEISSPADTARAFCSQQGACVVELRQEEVIRRIWGTVSGPEDGDEFTITVYEAYRSGTLLFRATYEHRAMISAYPLPMTVTLEHPDRKVVVSVEYSDVDLIAPADESVFTLLPKGEGPVP